MAHEYAEQIWNGLLADIGNEYGVAGLMGNLQAESGLCPYRVQGDFSDGYSYSVEYTSAVDRGSISKDDFVYNAPNGGGYGLAQWTFWSRKKALYEMWETGYASIGDVQLAIDYLLWELKTKYKSTYTVLKNASSIREASDKVLHDFENPADQSEAVEIKRASLGQNWYDQFHGTGGGSGPSDPYIPKKHKMSFLMLYLATRRKV